MANRIKGNSTQSFNLRNIPINEWNKLKIIHLREGNGKSLSDFCLMIILNYINEYISKNQLKPKVMSEEDFDEMDAQSRENEENGELE